MSSAKVERPHIRIGPTALATLATLAVLLPLYLATAAPDLTFWDASEFMTAAHTLGIPHPPGTPLWVAIAKVASILFSSNGPARSITMLSVVATAGACALSARLVARWLPGRGAVAGAVAAAVAAGTMSSVWANATETEVYAMSLLLSVAMLSAGEHAGHRDATIEQRLRGRALVAFLAGLAVPLHLSALVALPGACLLAWHPPRMRLRDVAVWGALALLGVSAILILPLRARHGPVLNSGNPVDLVSLYALLTRAQYEVPGLWPRRAPLWLQFGNIFQWADWQVALGLQPSVGPSWLRTPVSVMWGWFGVLGLRTLWHAEKRVGRAVAVLLLSGTAGVAMWLNLKAGSSFGFGVLPPDAQHEARERDYFFALGFWTWGLLAGVGIAWTASRLTHRISHRIGDSLRHALLVLAAVPLVANATVMDRTRNPDALLPRTFGRLLLDAVPMGGVLIVAGDNDTFPLWYLQGVEHYRDDVAVVTVPMLGAAWYRLALARNGRLLPQRMVDTWFGAPTVLRAIGDSAVARRRAIRVSAYVSAAERNSVQPRHGWLLQGLVYAPTNALKAGAVGLDLATLSDARRAVPPAFLAPLHSGVENVGETMQRLLKCTGIETLADPLLAAVCNGS